FERGVDESPEKAFDVVTHQLRRYAGDGEGVAGEALQVEADAAQLFEMRLEHGTLRGAALVEDRGEQMLSGRRVLVDPGHEAIEEDPLVRDVLVDEPQSAGRV